MAKIKVTNPKQIINGGAKKYYFKVKGVGGIKGDKGDKGDTGSQGPQGPQGNAATIEVGSTTTLPTGYDATVTNTGTINNAILNFGIPRGIKGDTGAKGDKGDKGDKGEQGNTGPQGPAGQNATVYIGTTTTGAPGTQASVYNSGTDRNATLNFTIPRGATGATGATGPQGPAGQDGQNFTPTIVETLPATGDQSKLYLTPKTYTTGTASGNPITITLGEDAGQITSAQLDGDTYQQSYTGKNLFDTANADIREQYILNDSGVEVSDRTGGYTCNYSKVEPSTGYILSGLDTIGGKTRRVYYYDENKGFISRSAQITTGSPTLTFTTPANCYFVNIQIFYPNDLDTSSWQLEAGSSATDYEPFVGGQPSPSPDYPQPIQTVTGEQTVTVVGKNRLNPQEAVVGTIDANTGEIVPWSGNTNMAGQEYIEVEPNTEYTIRAGTQFYYLRISEYTSDKANITRTQIADNTSLTITTTPNTKYIRWSANYKSISITNPPQLVTDTQMQIEKGAYSSYAPYHATNYPISLGSIELCKLGTYQDYIYKSGSDWKVHKATNKTILDGSSDEGWILNTAYPTEYMCNKANIGVTAPSGSTASVCSDFIVTSVAPASKGKYRIGASYLPFNYDNGDGGVELFKTWLSQHNVTVYTILATPTDTVITDTALIAQLEAVRNATLQASNTITNTATGTNLAGDLELGYEEYDPTNRYDKWLWLDLNNNYEKLGS